MDNKHRFQYARSWLFALIPVAIVIGTVGSYAIGMLVFGLATGDSDKVLRGAIVSIGAFIVLIAIGSSLRSTLRDARIARAQRRR